MQQNNVQDDGENAGKKVLRKKCRSADTRSSRGAILLHTLKSGA